MLSRSLAPALALVAGGLLLAGCGSSSSTDTAATADTRAASAACPVVPDAVSQGIIFRNALQVPITLRAEKVCGGSAGGPNVFSGDKGPAQLDGLQIAAGSSVDVSFEGVANRRLPFDLNPDVEGGLKPSLPWSIRLGFGATNGQGYVAGWDEGYERYVNGPDLETFVANDGTRFTASVQDGVVTFGPSK